MLIAATRNPPRNPPRSQTATDTAADTAADTAGAFDTSLSIYVPLSYILFLT